MKYATCTKEINHFKQFGAFIKSKLESSKQEGNVNLESSKQGGNVNLELSKFGIE